MKFWTIRNTFLSSVFKSLTIFTVLIFFTFFAKEKFPGCDNLNTGKVKSQQPWYFEKGSAHPKPASGSLKLWPNEAKTDRILDQLMFLPLVESTIKKKIFVETLEKSTISTVSQVFSHLNCPVKQCEIVSDEAVADAVIFQDFVTRIRKKFSFHQVWILHSLESPYFSGKVIEETSVNWTATYRSDSDLVTPYGKWVYYDDKKKLEKPRKNYAAGKTKKVAWIVSNCHAKNKRLEYAKALAEHISVDIYGTCGDKICLKQFDEYCREMISNNYKFYLSFENANCRDYITEKFFTNALGFDVVPIVMGAPKEDYVKVAPQNSFIHVEDFPSPKALANYLHFLDKNEKEYNSYFWWKGTGDFINTFFMCRLCALLHANRPNHFYKKITQWWRNPETCTGTFWNKTNEGEIMKSLKNFENLSKVFQ